MNLKFGCLVICVVVALLILLQETPARNIQLKRSATAFPLLSIYYASWTGNSNLGDDLLFEEMLLMFTESVSRLVHETRSSQVVQQSFEWQTNQRLIPILHDGCPRLKLRSLNNSVCIDAGILGGGSLFEPDFINRMGLILSARLPFFVFGSGYQDHFAPFSEDEERTLIEDQYGNGPIETLSGSKIPSSSLQHNLASSILKVTTQAHYGGPRGPLSRRFLRSFDSSYEKPFMYDAGLLAGIYFNSTQSLDYWRRNCAQAIKSNFLVAANYFDCDTKVCLAHNKTLHYRDVFARAMIFILENIPDSAIILYAMQSDQLQDLSNVVDLSSKLSPHTVATALDHKRLVVVPDGSLSCSQILSLHKLSKLGLNMKLHSMILSAAAKTPFVNLAYDFKSVDFALSIGMSSWAPSLGNIRTDMLCSLLKQMSQQRVRETLRQRIERHISTALANYQREFYLFAHCGKIESKLKSCPAEMVISISGVIQKDGCQITVLCQQQNQTNHKK